MESREGKARCVWMTRIAATAATVGYGNQGGLVVHFAEIIKVMTHRNAITNGLCSESADWLC
jgi:hypothetical protein